VHYPTVYRAGLQDPAPEVTQLRCAGTQMGRLTQCCNWADGHNAAGIQAPYSWAPFCTVYLHPMNAHDRHQVRARESWRRNTGHGGHTRQATARGSIASRSQACRKWAGCKCRGRHPGGPWQAGRRASGHAAGRTQLQHCCVLGIAAIVPSAQQHGLVAVHGGELAKLQAAKHSNRQVAKCRGP
jgi:hypothetical protein